MQEVPGVNILPTFGHNGKWYNKFTNLCLKFLHIETQTKWPPFPNDIFKCIFFNENVRISLKFVPKSN